MGDISLSTDTKPLKNFKVNTMKVRSTDTYYKQDQNMNSSKDSKYNVHHVKKRMRSEFLLLYFRSNWHCQTK